MTVLLWTLILANLGGLVGVTVWLARVARTVHAQRRDAVASGAKPAMSTRYRLAVFDANGKELAPIYAGDDEARIKAAWRQLVPSPEREFFFLDARCRTHRGRIPRSATQ